MSVELISVIMFGSMMLLLILGLPITFALGAVGILTAVTLWSPQAVELFYFSTTHLASYFMLVAIPLFLYMGIILEGSGITDDLFEMIHLWSGGINGGLAVGTIIVCVIIAAMAGVAGAATVTMGIIALPAMLKRGYDKSIATGTIQAGGALGFLIPPSVVAIMYALLAKVSLGKLFAGGVLPGLLLAGFYIAYILIRCKFQPHLGPALPLAERATWREKFISLRGLIMPIFLIFAVLGLIVLGVTSPTEASAVGVLGAILCAALHRRLSRSLIIDSLYRTMKITGMVMWVVIAAMCFAKVYSGLGAIDLVESVITGTGLGSWGILIIIQLSFFLLGMFLDDTAILFITCPLYVPIITSLGFDPVWFGILYIVNMQMAFLTPPFGLCLFYLKGVAPPEITMGDLYRSVWPFVLLQALGLTLIIIFPQIALWLPNLLWD